MGSFFMLLVIAVVVSIVLAPKAMDVTRGAVHTNTNTGTLKRSVDDRLFLLQAEIAPLTGFLKRMKRSQRCTDPKFEWVEKDLGTPITTANGAKSDSDTTITTASGGAAMFSANDIIWVPSTGERIKVVSVSGNNIDVTGGRAYGETSAAAIADGATLVRLAPAFAEGATSGSALMVNPTMPYNVTQIFRDFVECTRTEAQTDRYAEKNPKMVEKRKEAMILHLEAIERAYLFGELKIDLTGSTPRRVTRGLMKHITTNVTNMQGTFTKAKFDDFCESVFLYGGQNKILLASADVVSALHQEVFTNSNMQITPKTKEWGLSIMEYISPFGMISIVYHRLLSQVLNGHAIAVDLDKVEEKALQPTITKLNIQANDYDGFKDEILTEAGLQVMNQARHGYFYNI